MFGSVDPLLRFRFVTSDFLVLRIEIGKIPCEGVKN